MAEAEATLESVLEVIPQKYRAKVPVDKLTPHPKNARRHDVEKLDESLETNGFYGAVYAQESTGYILVGNGRYLRAVSKGLKAIPTIFLDVDDETALRIVAVDNATSDGAGYVETALASLLSDIAKGKKGLRGSGFGEDDLSDLLARVTPKAPSAPDSFPSFGSDIETEYRCPSCHFEWSGKPK